ncbi:cell wall-binding repeat-containing protein [Egibacter rhizosphaerae]|uniref:Cell wall-binding repeat-containing protein n=1 Tax=Egibacter rhizosphaerae TaxID=1670831 RepID=A0A411YIG0_9ACTN|nr:cell wall-binding repeat-containing protein [Egibacter rhizosphaerae]QBI21074.1 cell wall-binding repeat-containing protein [Egibacter rhizosphaerae]
MTRTTFVPAFLATLGTGTLAVLVAVTVGGSARADDHERDLAAQRLAGENRFDTAAAVAEAAFDPTDVDEVFVASGREFADALVGGPAAAAIGAPVLLTESAWLPGGTRDALEALRPDRVTVLGGTSAVADAVETELEDLAEEVRRWRGADRFETAATIATEAFAPSDVDRVYLATGSGFADGLTGGPAAAADGAPILLAGDDLPSATAEQLDALTPEEVVVLGGRAVLSDAVASEAAAAAGVETVERLWGPDRFATATEIAMQRFDPEATERAFVATGHEFADALTTAPAAASAGAPLLLVGASGEEPLSALGGLAVAEVTVLGGVRAVSHFAFGQMDGTALPASAREPAHLELNTPARVAAGEPFTIDAVVTDAHGRSVPSAGVKLRAVEAAFPTPLRTALDGVVRHEAVEDLDFNDGYEATLGDLEASARYDVLPREDVSTHHAGEDAEAAADCEALREDGDGAALVFPGRDGPGWDQAGAAPVEVDFLGCGSGFEGHLDYELWHEDDLRARVGDGTFAGALGEWRRFSFRELLHRSGDWRVEVFQLDAATGERLDYDEQTFTVD